MTSHPLGCETCNAVWYETPEGFVCESCYSQFMIKMQSPPLKTSEDVKDATDTSGALLLTALAAAPKKKVKSR